MMLVFYVANFLEKKSKIIGLSKTRKLRRIVQPNIVENFDASRNEAVKESLRIGFSEADSCNVKRHDQTNAVRPAPSVLARVPGRRRISPLTDRQQPVVLRELQTCLYFQNQIKLKAFLLSGIG